MNQHRWQRPVDDYERVCLLEGKRALKAAWNFNQKHPRDFPMNTVYALAEIRTELKRKPGKRTKRLPKPSPAPRTLAELFPEQLVKEIWELTHGGSFADAIEQAARRVPGESRNLRTFLNGIFKAMELAFLVRFLGDEFLPVPKISILHFGLHEIANSIESLKGLTREGFAEFLDDLCPCGLKNHKEAVRKMYARSRRIRRSKR